jgi:radical SAM family uncharacterized protein/radical SAM-linked protein
MNHPYATFLPEVLKPNRYTGREHGAVVKDWASVEARVCLAFPEVYDVGMSHLGYRILYKLLNDAPNTLAERCYAPWPDLTSKLHKHGQLLVSLESYRPLTDFDVVGFSLQFELTYTNVLHMLELGGIPLRSSERGDSDPLILAGGPVATHAEPVAIFFDAILIGDGEEALSEIALLWARLKKQGVPRAERLERLAELRGVYVPSLYEVALEPDTELTCVTGPKAGSHAPFPIVRRLVEDLDAFPFPDDGPVGGPEAIFDRMSIEVARGCTEGCRFCQAGMIYRPVRERDPETVVNTVISALKKSGQDQVSLTALSTADVSCISPLIKRLVEKTAPDRVSLSVASLRAYGLGEDLLDDMRQVRAAGLTFAPEAGTQRMRDVINKNVTEEQLLETAERVFSRGFGRMKLYFILGLPTETDEDVEGIVKVGQNALAVGKRLGKRAEVTVSVSTHVPKPHTPFQWCAQDPLDEIFRKQRLLRDMARTVRGLKLKTHEARTTVLEGILARGDRPLGEVVEMAYRLGARFDSWDEHFRPEAWQQAFEHFGVRVEKYLGTLPVSARLPWDHFDIGLEDGFLLREYQKALKSRLSPPCGKVAGMFIHHTNVQAAEQDARKLVCYDCGVACDLSRMRSQRIDWLKKMGPTPRALPVLAPPTPTQLAEPPSPIVAAGTREPSMLEMPRTPSVVTARPHRQDPEQHRPQRAAHDREARVRLRFTKTGPMALLGHLDLIRELPRVLRRSGLTMAYSKGFHPRPIMSFGPALALGIASVDEYLDAKLLDPPDADRLILRLNEQASEGLSFVAGRELDPAELSVTRVINEAEYLIALEERALPPHVTGSWLSERIRALLAAESHRIERPMKGTTREVDVRRSLLGLELASSEQAQLLARAGIPESGPVLALRVRIDNEGAVRLAELVLALLGKVPLGEAPATAQEEGPGPLAGVAARVDADELRGPGRFPFRAVRTALLASGRSPLLPVARETQLVAQAV